MIVCLLAVATEVAANTNLGGVFAMMRGRPYWYGAYFPVYFLLSALIMGGACIIFFFILSGWINRQKIDRLTEKALETVGKSTIFLLVILAIFTFWKMMTISVGGLSEVTAGDAFIRGPYALSFWGIEVIGGIIVPFVLLLISRLKNMMIMFIASAIMIFCIFFMRLDMVVAGQIVPLYFDLGVVEYSKLNIYTPSAHEILVVLGGVGFCALAFLLGEKIFDGFKQTDGINISEPVRIDVDETEEVS